nr:hypothetical protein [Tanacetum cinerariifolium]
MSSVPLHLLNSIVTSSPNHPTTDIEDAFSSNFPDYTTASPNYFPASPGNIFPDPPDNLSKYLLASLAISPFHDMQTYNAIANKPPIPPQDPITPPTILTPSSVLPPSLLFDPRYFLVSKELLPPKKQIHTPSSSSTTLSNSSRNQACILVPPSFSTYTPTPPQIFKIRRSSIKMRVKHHEKQIESILNYLEELSFHYTEKIEERLVNGWIITPRDFDEMPPKRTSTSKALAMNYAAIRKLVADSVATALEAQVVTMASTNNPNRNSRPRKTHVARKCTYEKFMSYPPFYFNGLHKVKGRARVAFKEEFRAAEEREVICEAQQGQSGVKREIFRSFRNKMDNEPILALPKGSDNFVVMREARVRMRA